MFKNYLILNESFVEILYLFINNNVEFAMDFMDDDEEFMNLNQEIIKYIKNNNIKYEGNKICIVVDGIIIGYVLLKTNLNLKQTKIEDFKFINLSNFDSYDILNLGKTKNKQKKQ